MPRPTEQTPSLVANLEERLTDLDYQNLSPLILDSITSLLNSLATLLASNGLLTNMVNYLAVILENFAQDLMDNLAFNDSEAVVLSMTKIGMASLSFLLKASLLQVEHHYTDNAALAAKHDSRK